MDHIVVSVEDVDMMVAFYTEVVGLSKVFLPPPGLHISPEDARFILY